MRTQVPFITVCRSATIFRVQRHELALVNTVGTTHFACDTQSTKKLQAMSLQRRCLRAPDRYQLSDFSAQTCIKTNIHPAILHCRHDRDHPTGSVSSCVAVMARQHEIAIWEHDWQLRPYEPHGCMAHEKKPHERAALIFRQLDLPRCQSR